MKTPEGEQQPDKQAIALSYDGANTPTVVAKGYAELAEEIIAVAKAHGVMVHNDPELSDSLAKLNVGEEIPQPLYVIIAELIAFAYYLDGRFPSQWEYGLPLSKPPAADDD
ncbi:EscU/YscU/HrcU family type III secretion system export apparatus switch protein [Idiomarina xiamenensis]|uniref:Flagellar biosynthetic protein FlhB n=1 Tax=Idiomarina xiamenensis 10-D-4 TaxID=740709 RepID=K2JZD6_9GAMM|nr:EscU/YscU/HrcU family type III secretion system export apparatus switch protein [Idiomarina xiamenensis]EKE80813.1 FlhB domain-containing protein [Idiomarina xiamenensis 10-D-4]